MGKVTVDIQEFNFSKGNLKNYDLAISVGWEHLSYGIMSPEQEMLVFKRFTFPFKTDWFNETLVNEFDIIFHQDQLLIKSFRKVSLSISEPMFTFVPDKLYRSDLPGRTYFKNLVDLESFDADASFLSGRIGGDKWIVFPTSPSLKTLFDRYQPGHEVHHFLSPYLQNVQGLLNPLAEKQVFVHVFSRFFFISYFKDQDLVFCNSFAFRSSKDFLYFILLVFHQFNLKPETVPLSVSGEIMEDSEAFQLLLRYINEVRFTSFSKGVQTGKQLQEQALHLYADVFSLVSCEL